MFNTLNAPAEKEHIKTMKNHSNTVSQNENDDYPETKLKVTEYCNLTDREFKIPVMNKQGATKKLIKAVQ